MPSTRSLLVAVALGAGALTTLSALPAGAATSSAQSQVTAALAAANSQKTVHYVATSTYSTRSIVITGDVSATEGQQQVVLHYGKNVGHMTNLLVGSAVYFKGDAYGLTAYLGLPLLARPHLRREVDLGHLLQPGLLVDRPVPDLVVGRRPDLDQGPLQAGERQHRWPEGDRPRGADQQPVDGQEGRPRHAVPHPGDDAAAHPLRGIATSQRARPTARSRTRTGTSR